MSYLKMRNKLIYVISFFILILSTSVRSWDDDKDKIIHVCIDSKGTKHFSDKGCLVKQDNIKENYAIRERKKDTVGFDKVDMEKLREERERESRYSNKSYGTSSSNNYKSTDSNSYNSDYFSLPRDIRWANDNPKGSSCYDAVQKVRSLGNNPQYDSNASIRREWSRAVDYATSLGCTL